MKKIDSSDIIDCFGSAHAQMKFNGIECSSTSKSESDEQLKSEEIVENEIEKSARGGIFTYTRQEDSDYRTWKEKQCQSH
jgi:hypothetical protein